MRRDRVVKIDDDGLPREIMKLLRHGGCHKRIGEKFGDHNAGEIKNGVLVGAEKGENIGVSGGIIDQDIRINRKHKKSRQCSLPFLPYFFLPAHGIGNGFIAPHTLQSAPCVLIAPHLLLRIRFRAGHLF